MVDKSVDGKSDHLMRFIADKMRPEDVGLSSDILFFESRNAVNGTPRITYSKVYECNNFSVRWACANQQSLLCLLACSYKQVFWPSYYIIWLIESVSILNIDQASIIIGCDLKV